MVIFSLEDLSLREIRAIRKSLDFLPITGVDAMFVAVLQNKLNEEIKQIEEYIAQEEKEKQVELEKAIKSDPISSISK
tara:strand:+ start:911 stop:1144 length:234 start_codon:yes stop_codon:yes gene_type:complete